MCFVFHTLVPLLQLLLVEMCGFLEVGQLLLGELALAVRMYNQLRVLYCNVFRRATGGEFLLEGFDAIETAASRAWRQWQ